MLHDRYLNCECRFMLPGVKPPASTEPSQVMVKDWVPIQNFAVCAQACLQEPSIRRFGLNGYACKLNMSTSPAIRVLCFSGCGAVDSQLEDLTKDVDFTEMSLQETQSRTDLTPLVFLCPNKRSRGCRAPDYCPSDFCSPGPSPQGFMLSQFPFGNSTVIVSADSDNNRVLIGIDDVIETYLAFTRCDGPLPQACIVSFFYSSSFSFSTT